MFLTVTANSALDRVMFIDRFFPGTVMRPDPVVDAVGGKGFDASVVLRAFDLDTLAVGIVAGDTGEALVHLLEKYGVRHDLLWVPGQTRVAHVLVETAFNRHSHIIAGGYQVTSAVRAALQDRCRAALPAARCLITGGSLPPGLPDDFYALLVAEAHQSGVPALVDCPGPPILLALPARPAVVKMNDAEFARTFGLETGSLELLKHQVGGVGRQYGIDHLVVTCGQRGILALTPAGIYLAACPAQQAVNAAGAGDAVSAVLSWRLSLGEPWPEALRWSAAAGAAVVLTPATAECRREDVDRLLPLAAVRPF